MHFVYIDDSKDGTFACFSALIIPASDWQLSLNALIETRRQMHASNGIYVRKEMHATEWNSGKGRIGHFPVDRPTRAMLFNFFLSAITLLPSVQLVNAAAARAHEERSF